MSFAYWKCKCPNKVNAMGSDTCRKCGARQKEYTTDGASIVSNPKAPKKSAKTPKTPRKTKRPPSGVENFIESTIKFINED